MIPNCSYNETKGYVLLHEEMYCMQLDTIITGNDMYSTNISYSRGRKKPYGVIRLTKAAYDYEVAVAENIVLDISKDLLSQIQTVESHVVFRLPKKMLETANGKVRKRRYDLSNLIKATEDGIFWALGETLDDAQVVTSRLDKVVSATNKILLDVNLKFFGVPVK